MAQSASDVQVELDKYKVIGREHSNLAEEIYSAKEAFRRATGLKWISSDKKRPY